MSTEENVTLEDAIRGMLGVEEEETPEEELTPETTDDPPEESEEEPQDDQEAAQDDEEASEEGGDETAAKLAELEAKYGKQDEDDPWLAVNELKAELLQEQEELQQPFLNGLPGIKSEAGKSIYEMPEEDFDKFLQQLDDDGKERLKVNAIQARENAVQKAVEYQQRKESFNQRLQQFQQANLEMEVISDIAQQLGMPEVVKSYQQGDFHKFAREKAKSDPSIAKKATTKEGLYQLAISAIRELNIVQTKDEKPKKPSAPDAKTVSKKVKTNPTVNTDEALAAKVSKSPSEYRKLDRATRDRLMYASIKDAL